MTEVRTATEREASRWRDDWSRRLDAWYGSVDSPGDWASQQAGQRVTAHELAAGAAVFAVTSGQDVVGMIAIATAEQAGQKRAMVSDVWIAEPHRRRGHAAAALSWARGWAHDQGGASLHVITNPAEPAHAALFAGYPVRAHQMIKKITGPDPLPAGLDGGPMTGQEFVSWREDAVQGYAADISDSGLLPLDQALAESAAQFDQLLPGGLSTENHTFLCLRAGAGPGTAKVATNWICHHRSPGLSFVYAVEVSEGHRGKGYGRAAMIIGEQATLAAGDTHLALNVFGHNNVAISMYQKMDYQAYDHHRSIDL